MPADGVRGDNQNVRGYLQMHKLFIGVAGVASAGAVAALTMATAAAATPDIRVSFAHDRTSSAGWSGHRHQEIVLRIGSGPISSVFAVATLHDFADTLPSIEPWFSTDNYNAGSPRWYIALSNGVYLFGYPPNAGLNGPDFGWSVNACGSVNPNIYIGWATALSDASTCGSTTITHVQIIADGDQSAGTTDDLRSVQFDGVALTRT